MTAARGKAAPAAFLNDARIGLEGRIAAELTGPDMTPERLVRAAAGIPEAA